MSDQLEWRRIYGRLTLFVGGVGVGDAYLSKGSDAGDVWRLRIWPEDRVQGGRERYVLAPALEETAKDMMLEMLKRGRGEAGG
jgi:hypothetical protein